MFRLRVHCLVRSASDGVQDVILVSKEAQNSLLWSVASDRGVGVA